MKVKEMVDKLELQVFAGHEGLEKEISGGYCADLLSDVMGNSRQGMVWITLQNHKNVVAVASLKELAAVILVNGVKPNADAAEQADKEGIAVLGTVAGAFETAGKLWHLLNE